MMALRTNGTGERARPEETARRFTLSMLAQSAKHRDSRKKHRRTALPTRPRKAEGVPVNRFPDFVRYMVQRLKVLCPHMGKVKMTQMLCRAGLHLSPSTVGRILKEEPAPKPKAQSAGRIVTARRPDHVCHTDLTLVPIVRGFWASWFPFALPQRWPFCWWVGCVVDHYSRRVMGFQIFRQQPSSRAMCKFLDRTIQKAGTAPRYIISDKGKQFWCDGYKKWCKDRGIRPRFGAIAMHGSIAVIERFFRSLKSEGTRQITVASRRRDFREQLTRIVEWVNGFRPHTYLNGRTPNESYYRRHPKSRYPRHEPRENWPRGSPNAGTNVPIRGKCGVPLELEVRYHAGEKHLPIVTINRAA